MRIGPIRVPPVARESIRLLVGGVVASVALAGCQTLHDTPATGTILSHYTTPVHGHLPGFEGAPVYTPEVPVTAPEALEATAKVVAEPDLWADMRNNMHLDKYLHEKRVQQEIRWVQKHPGYLPRLQQRMQRYLPYIYTQTQLRNLPAELALLPIVESALDTFAFSHGGAAGPWQFVRGTARQYGLEINSWYDGRRDIVASTDAALNYLSYLHGRFDDWYLALAGYNAGQGNVSKAKRRNPGAGFFDLKLPRETQAYVPRLLALAAIVEDPAKYNISLPELKPVEAFTTLDTHSQFQLDKLAAAIDLPMAQLYEWNPALNQWSTPPKGPHRIIVPTELDLAKAQQAIDDVAPRARVDWKEVVVQSGDTLSAIARRHATDVTSLQLANGLSSSRIRAGKTLLIPQNAQALDKQSPHASRGNTAATKYTVQAGDSLWSIARAHNVNLRKLIRHNEVGPRDTLRVGRTLTIPGEATSTRKVTRTVRYKVRKGDSLARIANKFNVSIKQIANWNNLDTRRYIKPGQGLLLHVNVIGG